MKPKDILKMSFELDNTRKEELVVLCNDIIDRLAKDVDSIVEKAFVVETLRDSFWDVIKQQEGQGVSK